MGFLAWLDHSRLAAWVVGSDSIWAYPMILTLHAVGMAFLVGTSAAIDLRLLGVARQLPLEPLRKLFPILWAGLWINLLSGTALFISEASKKGTSYVFLIKMSFVTAGIITMVLLKGRVLGTAAGVEPGRETLTGRVLAGASLLSWAGAITAGRLMAYIHW